MMKALAQGHVYGILDLGYVDPEAVGATAAALVDGGVDVLQLRAKGFPREKIAAMAGEVVGLTRASEVPLIINDHPEVAVEVGADGVHVGQDDQSVAEVRAVVGDDFIVGKSTHSLDQAREAAKEPVDYIGFGPLFATPTKPDYRPIGLDDIATVHRELSLPIFCIGGIKKENLAKITARGARRVVIVSGILQSADFSTYISECQSILAEG